MGGVRTSNREGLQPPAMARGSGARRQISRTSIWCSLQRTTRLGLRPPAAANLGQRADARATPGWRPQRAVSTASCRPRRGGLAAERPWRRGSGAGRARRLWAGVHGARASTAGRASPGGGALVDSSGKKRNKRKKKRGKESRQCYLDLARCGSTMHFSFLRNGAHATNVTVRPPIQKLPSKFGEGASRHVCSGARKEGLLTNPGWLSKFGADDDRAPTGRIQCLYQRISAACAAKAAPPLRRLIRGETPSFSSVQSIGDGRRACLLPRIPFRLPLVFCEAECRTRSHRQRGGPRRRDR